MGVDVYVIDTGIRKTHSEFTGRVKPGAFIDYGDGNGIERLQRPRNPCGRHGRRHDVGGRQAGGDHAGERLQVRR